MRMMSVTALGIVAGAGVLAIGSLLLVKLGQKPRHASSSQSIIALPRPLSNLEKWYAAHPSAHIFSVSAALEFPAEIAQLSDAEFSSRLARAIRCAVAKYPKFGTAFLVSKNQVVPLPAEVSYSEVVSLVSGTRLSWDDVAVANDDDFSLDDLRPLFKVVVNRQAALLAVKLHHIVADALSAAHFMDEVICQCIEPSTERMDERNGVCVSGTHPSIEDVLDLRIPLWKGLQARFMPPKASEPIGTLNACDLAVLRPSAWNKLKNGPVFLMVISSRAVEQMVKECSHHQSSVTSSLSVAASWATYKTVSAMQRRHGSSVSVFVPVSLRHLMEDAGKVDGLFIGAADLHFSTSQIKKIDDAGDLHYDDYWKLAGPARIELATAAKRQLPKIGLLSMMSVPELQRFMLKNQYSRPYARTADLEISNLGLLKLHKSIKHAFFSLGSRYDGPVFSVSVATVNSTMTISITAPVPIVSSKLALLWTENFKSIVTKVHGLSDADIKMQ
eukprot:ANDGO_06202.mRNA.1 hypothetical protein